MLTIGVSSTYDAKKSSRRLEFQTMETKIKKAPGSKKKVHYESKGNFRQIIKLGESD